MPTDAELLRRYAESDSQEAFTVLVQRHLPFTYAAALRQVGGNAHLAQEIVQRVFTLLARKARSLANHPVLIGWLCTTTFYTAAKLRRAERRRAQAEVQAVNETLSSPDLDWDAMRPVIDGLLLELKERDRTAVLLRFFSAQTYSEVGRNLGLTENAARMRVDRALDALRQVLRKRGIVSTAAALGAFLSAQSMAAVPEGLSGSVAASAVSAVATGGGAAIFMGSTFVKIGMGLAVLAVGSLGFFLHRQSTEENARLREKLAVTERQLTHLQAEQLAVGSHSTDGENTTVQTDRLSQPEPSTPRAQALPSPDRQRAFLRLRDLRDVGQGTPDAAAQTVVWAVLNGDPRLPEMVYLNRAARDATVEIMAVLTPGERAIYDTPEKVAALFLSKYVLAKIRHVETVKIDGVTQLDPETAEVRLLSGEQPGPSTISMRLTATGWLWKVKASLMENAKKEMLAPAASSSTAALKNQEAAPLR